VRTTVLNSSQVLILQAMAQHRQPMTAREIEERSGAPASADNLGPVYQDSVRGDRYTTSLLGLGYVDSQRLEGEPVTWFLTSAGRKAARVYRTRRRGDFVRVPPDVLDPVVRNFKKTRIYGFEVYTEDDLSAIRQTLGDDYHGIPLEELRDQIVCRRKQGAFADKSEKTRRAVDRVIREFGPHGTILSLLTESQLEDLYELCAEEGEDEG
jgi:hypothetical protein